MALLDITAMEQDNVAIRAIQIPQYAIARFQKQGDFGPFTLMVELDKLPDNTKYLQVTVDFNESKLFKIVRDALTGDIVDQSEIEIRIGQRGRPNNLVPYEHIAAPPRAYSYLEKCDD